MLKASCESCGKSYQVPDDKAGRKFRCKACGEGIVKVPDAHTDDFDDDDEWASLSSKGPAASSASSVKAPAPRRTAARKSSGGKKKKSRNQNVSNDSMKKIVPLAVGGVAFVAAFIGAYVGVQALMNGSLNFLQEDLKAKYVHPDAMVVAHFRPRQIKDNPLFSSSALRNPMIPGGGFNPLEFDAVEATLWSLPPGDDLRQQSEAGVALRFETEEDRAKCEEQFGIQNFQSVEYNGNEYLKPQESRPIHPRLRRVGIKTDNISAYKPDAKALVIMPEEHLKLVLDGTNRPSGYLKSAIGRISSSDDMAVHIDFQKMNWSSLENRSGPGISFNPLAGFMDSLKKLQTAGLRLRWSGNPVVVAELTSSDSTSINDMKTKIDEFLKLAEERPTRNEDDEAMKQDFMEGFKATVNGNSLNITFDMNDRMREKLVAEAEKNKPKTETADSGNSTSGFGASSGDDQENKNKLKQIGLALHNHHNVYRRFPVAENPEFFDSTGKPHLSWRVHLLPFLEHNELYEKFHLNEPWDSPHNKALLNEMPAIYLVDGVSDYTKTTVLGFAGEKAAFGDGSGVRFRDVRDGMTNTLAVVIAAPNKAVPWTKPEDINYSGPASAASLIGPLPRFWALLMDGSVRSIAQSIDAQTLSRLIEYSDGQVVGTIP